MTVYSKAVVAGVESWSRTQVPGVSWQESKAANVMRSGLLEADRVNVFVPLPHVPAGLDIQIGDVLVRGLVTDTVSPSFTITALKAKYPRSATVRSVDPLDFSSARMQHLQLGAS